MRAPEPDEEPEPRQGRITPTGPGPLVIAGAVGMVLGWAVRPLCLRLGFAEPDISLLSVGLLFFAAAIIGGSAYVTRRMVQRHRSALAHHQAVNRLVLAKACALTGALLTGCYLGYVVAQIGVGDPGSLTRLWHAAAAALGAATATTAALLLEQACRVPGPPE